MLTSTIDTPLLVDHHRSSSFKQTGYTTAAVLDQTSIDCLAALADVTLKAMGTGFFTSVMQPPSERRRVHDLICQHLVPAITPHLQNYRVVLASIVGRSPGSGQSDLPLHQDWSFVDETRAQSMSIWIPLQPVTPANGCMQVVAGSHRHNQPLRHIGSGFRYNSIEADLRKNYLTDVNLEAGEALFFDHRLIHGSNSNHSDKPRLALGAVLLPRNEPLHMGITSAGKTEFANKADDFLLTADLANIARPTR